MPGEVAALIAATSPPQAPKVCLGLQVSPGGMVNSPIRSWLYPVPPAPDRPCLLDAASIPPIDATPSRSLYAQLARQKLHRLARKSARTITLGRHRPSLAKSAGLPAKPGGENAGFHRPPKIIRFRPPSSQFCVQGNRVRSCYLRDQFLEISPPSCTRVRRNGYRFALVMSICCASQAHTLAV